MKKLLYDLKEVLLKNNLKLSAGESCTGGLISSYLTDIDGASGFIEENFVTYAPSAKHRFLGVKMETIEKYGIVSKEVAKEMAEGLLEYSDASIATTGFAGASDDEKNPMGTVYIGLGLKNPKNVQTKNVKFVKYVSKFKTRERIKKDFSEKALRELYRFLKQELK